MNILLESINTPWRAINEIKMMFVTPMVKVIAIFFGVKIGDSSKFYGFPVFQKWSGSTIHIGKSFVNRNQFDSNSLGINHPTIFSTRSKSAKIIIGDNVGISGGSICAATSIAIGDYTLIGSNCDIFDTDFHSLDAHKRLDPKQPGKTKPINIGKNVFIGTSSIILKGVNIGDNSIVAAGSIVARNIPKNSIYIAGRIKKHVKG